MENNAKPDKDAEVYCLIKNKLCEHVSLNWLLNSLKLRAVFVNFMRLCCICKLHCDIHHCETDTMLVFDIKQST